MEWVLKILKGMSSMTWSSGLTTWTSVHSTNKYPISLMTETQIITSIIGGVGLLVTLCVLINAFKFQGSWSIRRSSATTQHQARESSSTTWDDTTNACWRKRIQRANVTVLFYCQWLQQITITEVPWTCIEFVFLIPDPSISWRSTMKKLHSPHFSCPGN